jgi:hypothetical protein
VTAITSRARFQGYGIGCEGGTFRRSTMTEAMKKTGTRFSQWFKAFRQQRFYSRFE